MYRRSSMGTITFNGVTTPEDRKALTQAARALPARWRVSVGRNTAGRAVLEIAVRAPGMKSIDGAFEEGSLDRMVRFLEIIRPPF